MPYDYDRLTGRIHLENDSDAAQEYKAGAVAIAIALRAAGWPEESVTNALRTHFDSVAAVLADYLRELEDTDIAECGNPMWEYIAKEITPLPRADHCQCFSCPKCPCRPDYCNACHPEKD